MQSARSIFFSLSKIWSKSKCGVEQEDIDLSTNDSLSFGRRKKSSQNFEKAKTPLHPLLLPTSTTHHLMKEGIFERKQPKKQQQTGRLDTRKTRPTETTCLHKQFTFCHKQSSSPQSNTISPTDGKDSFTR